MIFNLKRHAMFKVTTISGMAIKYFNKVAVKIRFLYNQTP
jgi:hypothetical protein